MQYHQTCPIGPFPYGRISSPITSAARAGPDGLLRGEVPINRLCKCARAPAHVRAGPRGNALRFHGECAVVTGHLRARHVAGKTAFLDGRTAQLQG